MTKTTKLPWPVRALALAVALLGLAAHVGLVSCVRRPAPERATAAPQAPVGAQLAAPDAAAAPASAAPVLLNEEFMPATKAGPVHLALPPAQPQAPARTQAPAQR